MRIIIFPTATIADAKLLDVAVSPNLVALYWNPEKTYTKINFDTGEKTIVNIQNKIKWNIAQDGRIAVEYQFSDHDWLWLKTYWSTTENKYGDFLAEDGTILTTKMPSNWE